MRDRTKIMELRQYIETALAAWTYERVVPQMTSTGHAPPLREPARCSRCGNIEPARLIYGRPGSDVWKGNAFAFCGTCYPDLPGKLIELHDCERRQTPRDQEAQRLRYRHRLAVAAGAGLPARLSRCWFRTYVPRNPSQVEAVDQLGKWILDDTARDRLPFCVLHGPPGVGKTHLLVAAWRRFYRARVGSPPVFFNEGLFANEWQRSHARYEGRGGEGMKPAELIEHVSTASVLVWDDLGKAKLTEAWGQVLYQIMDYRSMHMLPTLVSTNFGPDELPSRVAPWTADRVTSGLTIEVAGESMRGAA